MNRTIAAGLIALFAHAPLIAHADEIDDLTAAEDKMYDAWSKVALTDRKIAFVKQSASGYGIYEERANAAFKGNEPIITYVEPIGYDWKELPGDKYEIDFVCDIKLKSTSGEVLIEKPAFLKSAIISHNANTEAFIDLTLTINGGLPTGKYVLEYTVHDANSGEDMTFTQDMDYTE